MEDTSVRRPTRRVIGDTPEHGKHLLYDSGSDMTAECNGGLAFAIGCAVVEAETARDAHRFWQVQHPNGNVLYHIMFVVTDSHAVVVKVC